MPNIKDAAREFLLNPQPVNQDDLNDLEKNATIHNQQAEKSNENVVASPSEVTDSNLSDYQKWQKENPGGGAYEYAYAKSTKAPQSFDEQKAKKKSNLAGIADLAMLLSDGIAAAGGGTVNKRTTSATQVNNEALSAARERHKRLRGEYDSGLTKARYQDLTDKDKRAEYLQKLQDEQRTLKQREESELRILKERNKLGREDSQFEFGLKQQATQEERQFNATEKEKDRTLNATEKSNDRAARASESERDRQAAKDRVESKPTQPTAAEIKEQQSSQMYDNYNQLSQLYQQQLKAYNDAKAKNKKAVSSDLHQSDKATDEPFRTDVETYVGINKGHLEKPTTTGSYLPGKKTTKKGAFLPK